MLSMEADMWSVMQSTLGSLAEQITKYMLLLHIILIRIFCTGLDKQKGCNKLQKQRVLSNAWEVR